MIHLVRHARAGQRGTTTGPDRERPLSANGLMQAAAIAEALTHPVARLLSSPYLRCVQTLAPLAERSAVPIEMPLWLSEGAGPDEAAAAVRASPAGTVLCSHGDVLHAVVGLLAAEGAPLDPHMRFAKGAVLSLEVVDGRIVAANYTEH